MPCQWDGAQESGNIAPSTRGLALAKPHAVSTGWTWGWTLRVGAASWCWGMVVTHVLCHANEMGHRRVATLHQSHVGLNWQNNMQCWLARLGMGRTLFVGVASWCWGMVVTHPLCHANGMGHRRVATLHQAHVGLHWAKPHPVVAGWAWDGLQRCGQLASVGHGSNSPHSVPCQWDGWDTREWQRCRQHMLI